MYKTSVRLSVVIVATFLMFVGCASVSSPQGGPRDSLAPRVVSSVPLPYALNFKGKKVTLNFDEFVVLKDQQKLFFISPEATKKPILSVKGRSIVVEFQDTLAPQTTYRLDFGSSITDNNEGNKMDNFSFVFSTGDHIDSLLMVGQSLDARTGDTVVGAFVDYFDFTADSTFATQGLDSTLFKARADAVFRTDSSGYFVADILKEKPYRIYAIMDKNGNQRYEAGTDLVGFLDSIYDPSSLHGFSFRYDSVKRRTYIDSLQVKFNMFEETLRRRQTLSAHTRTGRNKLELLFNSSESVYDSLVLDSIPYQWLMIDRGLAGDTVSIWIAPPTLEHYKALKDTIKGSIVYQRQDSLWQFYSQRAELKFINKTFVKKEAKKSKKELEADRLKADKIASDSTYVDPADTLPKEKEPNPFRFEVIASTELNPERGIGFKFDFPLRLIDSSRIELTRVDAADEPAGGVRRGAVAQKKVENKPIPEKFTIHHNSLHNIVLNAVWKVGSQYHLMIPSGTFEDIAFQSNDTLNSSFKILDPDKFGTISIATDVDTMLRGKYIVELLFRNNGLKLSQRRVGVHAGDNLTFRYLPPGKYVIRVTEDSDGDEKWTTGDLIHRRQPERVRTYLNSTGGQDILAKENWEIVEHLNIGTLFDQE